MIITAIIWIVPACLTLFMLYKVNGSITIFDLVMSILFGPIGAWLAVMGMGDEVVLWEKKK